MDIAEMGEGSNFTCRNLDVVEAVDAGAWRPVAFEYRRMAVSVEV